MFIKIWGGIYFWGKVSGSRVCSTLVSTPARAPAHAHVRPPVKAPGYTFSVMFRGHGVSSTSFGITVMAPVRPRGNAPNKAQSIHNKPKNYFFQTILIYYRR